MVNQVIIPVLLLVVIYVALLALRRITHRFWPSFIHPLDGLLPALIILSALQINRQTVMPVLLWIVMLWLVIGLLLSWRTFQGRHPIPYGQFALLYWRVSDLFWIVIYGLSTAWLLI
ncbi:hypothetical protein JCM31185_05850 [Furfurilactobacillus curtus]|uniref:DUF3397 domain-containing protein n=1 Tax=Furfurilactobacillus curtus TaxID=1746200 RepID=A0ABQ5JLP9_9LACO